MSVTVLAFRHRPDDDDYAYWRALSKVWNGIDTIVNVEHDMEFSDDLVTRLVDCPHALCTHAYRVWMTGQQRWVYAPTYEGRHISHGVAWASTASLGLCKITREVRISALHRRPWKFLEHSVCASVKGPWHVHWPAIRHYHDYDGEAWENASDWERFCAENGEPCHLVPSEIGGP